MTARENLLPNELPKHTPWGAADSGERYDEGIIRVGTPGHGGFLLDDKANSQVHQAWRRSDRAYEEDGDWAIVAASFPDLFSEEEKDRADKILRNWKPDQYTAVTGTPLQLAESMKLRQRKFEVDNKTNYVAVSAIGKGDLVKVTAALGGDRNSKDRKTFMVPRGEYTHGENGFVIDPAKHPEIAD